MKRSSKRCRLSLGDRISTFARLGFTLVELLVVIVIIAAMLAIFLPAVQMVRESARGIQCTNNLKQLGLAMLSHEQAHRHLPTGGWGYRWVGDPTRGYSNRQPGGWIFCILPELEQQNVYSLAIGFQSEEEKRQRLAEMIQLPVPTLYCPSRRSSDVYPNRWQPFNSVFVQAVAKTDYAANAGDIFVDVGSGPLTLVQGDSKEYHWPSYEATGISYLRSTVRLAEVLDGTTNTYMIGEKNIPYREYLSGNDRGDDQSMYSGDDFDTLRWTSNGWTPLNDRMGENAEARFGAAHSAGCSFALCDGSVKRITYSVDPEVHRNLGNRRDGKVANIE